MTDDAIERHLQEQVNALALGGYVDLSEAQYHLEDLMEDEGLDEGQFEQWKARLSEAFVARKEQQSTWADVTANDSLERAFAELRSRGIVALENAGYTMSDGWSDVHEARDDVPDARGAVFFHGQDVEGAIQGAGLHLAFGSFESGPEHEAKSLEVAQEACSVLKEYGLQVEWDGLIHSRPKLNPFPWKKRRR